MALTVSLAGTHLERDGTVVPLIVDTIWAAYCDVPEDDWRVYLRLRRRQGFTAVLTTILPIVHDRTEGRESRYPYARRADGTFDWTRPDEGYLATARRFVQIARQEYGLEVIIAVTWNNYLPGTWGSRLEPDVVMPRDVLLDHTRRVAAGFGDLDPIWAVGGDDGYDSPAANDRYHQIIDLLRELSPHCLITTHPAPLPHTPDDLLDRFDLHLFQSGHNLDLQSSAWSEAIRLSTRTPRRPVVNVEPPYEWHGVVNGAGRWSPHEVRTACWASVLSGAGAGIGYAAHGVWMWSTTVGHFLQAPSLEPATWVEAMSFPGVRDVALMRYLITEHRLYRLAAAQHLLPEVPDARFRAGASPQGDLLAVYLPYDRPVLVADDLGGRELIAWDLATRAPFVPEVQRVEGGAVLRPAGIQQDALVMAMTGRDAPA